jgi:hypothetical protein
VKKLVILLVAAALAGSGTLVGAQGTVPAPAKAQSAKLETKLDEPKPQTKGKKAKVPRKTEKTKPPAN